MLITSRQLLHLSVETESGVHLGHVVGFEFEVDAQTILRYEVRRVPLLGAPLLVARDQVKSISHEKMVVEDAVVGDRGAVTKVFQKPSVDAQPAPLTELAD